MLNIDIKSNSLKDRLLFFVQHKGLSKSEFERKCNLSNGFIDKCGDNTRRKILDKISNVFSELNTNWLLTGEGEMLKSNNIGHTTTSDNSPINGDTSINEYKMELEMAKLTISHLEQRLKDKDEIIELLKNKKI